MIRYSYNFKNNIKRKLLLLWHNCHLYIDSTHIYWKKWIEKTTAREVTYWVSVSMAWLSPSKRNTCSGQTRRPPNVASFWMAHCSAQFVLLRKYTRICSIYVKVLGILYLKNIQLVFFTNQNKTIRAVVLFYNTITTIHCNTIKHNTIQNKTIQYNTIQYNTIQYNTIQYNTIQYNTIQYNII